MKTPLHSSIALALTAAISLTSLAHAASIDHSTITEVVKDATVLQVATKGKKTARVNDVFAVPDVMRTGVDSRVEMVAEDQTVTRVGANTIFSFEPEKREINLQKGSLLFNSPKGKGGGTIRTAAATAAVQGTTLIVVTTKNGGFKTLLLEGHGIVKSNGQTRSIGAGQMVYVLPGGDLSGVLNFHLAEQVGVARLVSGFKTPLASKDKIDKAIAKQEAQIAKGQLVTTGLLASEVPTQAYKVDTTVALDVIRSPERKAAQQQITSAIQAGLLDATITNAPLEANRIYTSARDVAGLFPGTNAANIPPNTSVFFARNTTIQTNTIDLSSYPGTFLFYSTGDLIYDHSFSITGGLDEIGIVVSGAFRQSRGALVSLDAKEAFVYGFGSGLTSGGEFISGSPVSLVDGGFVGSGNLFLFGSSIDLQRSMLTAQNGTLEAFTPGDFTAVGNGTDAPQFVSPTSVALSAGKNLTLSNSVTSTLDASVYATNDMTLTNVAFLTSGGLAKSVNAHAGNMMTLTNVAFQAQSVALDARTLALTNVAFNGQSRVTLRSETGLLATRPNTNRPVELGKVNFIQNVTYGGKPAQNYVGEGITISK